MDKKSGACLWRLGGAGIPGATNTFGGTSAAEYGAILALNFVSTSGAFSVFQDFRNILGSNPCDAPPANLAGPKNPVHFGTIKMGSSSMKKVRVSNLSYAPILINGLAPSGADYSVVADGCTGLLGPFAKCLVTVKFAPSMVGADNGMLTFDGDEDTPFFVSLVGTGK